MRSAQTGIVRCCFSREFPSLRSHRNSTSFHDTHPTLVHIRSYSSSKWIGPQLNSHAAVLDRRILDSFVSKPYYIHKDTLDSLFYSSLSALYGQKDTKALVVSSFHPGASQMTSSLLQSLSESLGARYVELDYFKLLSQGNSIMPPSSQPDDPEQVVRPFELSSIFQPSLYQTPKVIPPSSSEEIDATDREEFSTIDDTANMQPMLIPKVLSLNDVFIKMIKTGGKDESHSHNPDSYRLHIRMGDDHSRSLKDDLGISSKSLISHRRTAFDLPCEHVQLKSLLYPFLQDPKTPFILHIREVSDILESNRKAGKSLLLTILNQIESYRTKTTQPILVILSSQPPLTNSLNLLKPHTFFSSLTKGSVQEVKSGKIVNLASNLKMYNTHLDNPIDKFTKICIRHGSLPTGLNNRNTTTGTLDPLWDTLRADTKLRIMQINLASLKLECQRRELGLFPALGQTSLMTQGRSWSLVSSHVWSTYLTRRIADLVVGFDLEQKNLSKKEKLIESSSVLRALDLIAKLDADALSNLTRDTVEMAASYSKRSQRVSSTNTVTGAEKVHIVNEQSADSDNIGAFVRQRGIQLNSYEKKLLKTVVNPSQINVGFSEVILPPPTKSILQTLVTLPILRPDLFATGILANYSINGLLLFGPPGTGKTMLAKAAAKSCGARFMGVSLSDIFDKYVGEGEKNVRAIFSLARKLSPCIVFLDEVDAIFGARMSEGTMSSRRELINEFMLEWDGVTSNNRGIVIVGATNRPFDLDDAILRRMPRRVLIDLPDANAREQILRSHLGNEEVDSAVSLSDLAEKTKFYSGSDIKNLLVSASLARAKEVFVKSQITANSSTRDSPGPLTEAEIQNHFVELTTNVPQIEPPPSTDDGSQISPIGPLCSRHFHIAFKEVPPSLSQEATSLVELRKWNEKFGEHAFRSQQKSNWGFA